MSSSVYFGVFAFGFVLSAIVGIVVGGQDFPYFMAIATAGLLVLMPIVVLILEGPKLLAKKMAGKRNRDELFWSAICGKLPLALILLWMLPAKEKKGRIRINNTTADALKMAITVVKAVK